MPNKQSEKLLRELSQKSKEYAEKSTRLSDLIEEAEAILQNLPGKLEVTVGDGSTSLTFCRTNRDWCLLFACGDDFGETGPWEPVKSQNVHGKAAAAKLLPQLFEAICAEISGQLGAVDAGLNALQSIPFLSSEMKEDDQ